MPALTLRDVATHCGVSTATVSAVVNGAEWVSPATRVRVQRAVDEMGYRPNQFARGLKTQRGYAVGVIVSDLTNPFFTEVVRSLSHALHAGGRAHFLCDTDHRSDVGESSLRMLADNHVVGLVLIGDSVPGDAVRRYVRRRGHVPIVAIERDYDLEGVSTLLVDSELGAYTMVRHLLGQGHRRIALITGPSLGGGSATFGREQRLHGYQRALRDVGIDPDPGLVVEGNFRYAGGQHAMRRLLASGRIPDAVFASNDMMALGAMSVLRDAGLRIPDDIAIAGFDDIPPAALTTPGLTTMAMPMSELGRAAAQLLGERLVGSGLDVVRKVFDPQLVVRHSSGHHAGARQSA
ncbi:regulatory protein LacI (plasmid) [Gemmatirosa kalamazoonensis]|uniref:Regulatory protein LacI n=1 Tax=Gemmatirosa kalamazoonensis TaxID=861299 RepID=W0RQZ5_9BACT|nr:LacI family DNA-binding transcriptional regulator [Gemmatirosa kalamazoonensis]AHG93131.1 regulatory protein LacI [Gemmatirosa kalamazoonensis]